MSKDGYDVIVVGGGSAGCVLAARLTEDPSCRVLLLEAGPDYLAADLPPWLVDGTHGPNVTEHDWALRGEFAGHPLDLPRGRVIGGCSSINATFALRGSPLDYDAWNIPGWSFADVLPHFIALETDLDHGAADYHGSDGPLPIRRYSEDELSAVAAASHESIAATGVPVIADHNAPGAVGVAPLPVNTVDGRRISTSLAYLDPARHRPNLTVRGNALVTRVEITNGRAGGVRLDSGEVVAADEVIVSAGAYLSPTLLRASGVAAPGVGANLADHAAVSIDLPYYGPTHDVPVFQLVATTHSSYADPATDPPDLQIVAGGPWGLGGDEPPVFFLGAALLKPRSRGKVGETIDLNYFAEPHDLERLAEGLARVEEAIAGRAVQELCHGERITPRLTGRGLREWIPSNTWTYHHPVGTCALGSVVDEQCRVIGYDGLSVVDASVMPDIPSANTNIPTIMIAERVAAMRLHNGAARARAAVAT